MNKVMTCLSYIVIIIAMLVSIGIAFNLLYPYPTITMQDPAPICNKDLKAGDTVQACLIYTKYTDKPARVTRQFVDGIVYTMPVIKSNLPMGEGVTQSYSTQIPNGLPPGTYYVRVTLEYDFPPLRVITYTFNTESFTVR
jgi:hypothetical protein